MTARAQDDSFSGQEMPAMPARIVSVLGRSTCSGASFKRLRSMEVRSSRGLDGPDGCDGTLSTPRLRAFEGVSLLLPEAGCGAMRIDEQDDRDQEESEDER